MSERTHDPQDETAPPKKLSRRNFLKITGGSAVGSAVVSAGLMPKGAKTLIPGEVVKGLTSISLKVNGKVQMVRVEPRTILLAALRHQLGLTGSKEVCDRGTCGACTVLMNGTPVLSCMTLAVDAVGKDIITVEGLGAPGRLDPVQQAFVEHDALMCGFCTPGFVMSVRALLNKHPQPTETQVREGVSGNLCRCGAYPKVFEAALDAAKKASRPGGTRGR